MANVSPGSVYKHRVFCYSGNQAAVNTRYFVPTLSSGSAQTEQALATALDAIFAPAYKPAMHSLAQYIGSDLQNIETGPPYPVQLAATALTGNGTATGNPLPQQISGIYTIVTSFTGRGFRGRAYIPFPAANHATNATPPLMTSGYQTLLAGIADVCSGVTAVTFGGSTYELFWVIRHAPTVISPGLTTTDITGFKVGVNWATQRRRGDFGRTNAVPIP